MTFKAAKFPYKVGATPINGDFAQWVRDKAEGTGQIRFEHLANGGVAALTLGYPGGRDSWGHVQGDAIFYGMRKLLDSKPEGYALHGRTSIAGKKYRCFTSSTMLELPDGGLVDIAVLYICDPPSWEDVGEVNNAL